MSLLKLRLQYERNLVHARQRARDVAAQLGFDQQDQVRIATAVSELARNAFRYAKGGMVEFEYVQAPQPSLRVEVTDSGPGITRLEEILAGRYVSTTGLGKGLIGTRQLMDSFHVETSAQGTCVQIEKRMPRASADITPEFIRRIRATLASAETDPFGEVERQNQELLRTLAELREKQEMLAQLNDELEDTNRGVVALYAELEQSSNELRRVSDLKTSFLSNLSHEFRTPLNAILALCQLLEDRADGDLSPEQDKQVSYIRRSASDLSEMVNDLLDLAKVEAGKVEIKSRPFSVEDLFGALRGMFRGLFASTQLELTLTVEANFPLLQTDEGKLSQILRNLIANALKFTEHGGVHVTATVRAGSVLFEVADTGIGIAPEHQRRIFEEFEQIDNQIQTAMRGTGLGLPLSRKLAQLLGGTLDVDSALGQGSKFRVQLPLRYTEGLVKEPLPIHDLSRPTVLLIEDNLETRFIHLSALKGRPFALHAVQDLEGARAFLRSHSPALIVLDRMLHGQDSLSFIAESRTTGYRGRVLVVSVSEDAEAPVAAGADAFLAKPVTAGVLGDTIEKLLHTQGLPTVLLVDDDEINRYLLREALAPYSFRLLEARTGREALQIAEQDSPSLIFLDVAMPGFTGLETLREFRAGASTLARTPIIIHTSKDLTEAERNFIASCEALLFPKQALAGPDAAHKLRDVLQRAGLQ